MAPEFNVLVFLSYFLLLLSVVANDCMPTSCRDDGPIIRFPFRHKYRQPQHCGYDPGFDLYCNQRNETVIVLPVSVEFIVKEIDYVSQRVVLFDRRGCFHENLQFLNASASTFQFLTEIYYPYYLLDLNIFNCSTPNENLRFYSVQCLSKSSYGIYVIPSGSMIVSLELVSCTKLYKVCSAPRISDGQTYLYLRWFEPACERCESQGKRCSLKHDARDHQLLCDNEPMKSKGVLRRLLVAGEVLGSLLCVAVLVLLYRLYVSIREDKENKLKVEMFLKDYRALKPTRFTFADLRRMTNEFSERLGEGGYGIVYKGKLSGEIYVAVKVLNNSLGIGEEFINEVGTIGRIHHVNVVRLVGYCADGLSRALVYEFLPNDSLEKLILVEGADGSSFSVEKMHDIALGIARGIEYLHEGCDQQILHFDIKPNNILLDRNFNPKICDFGLAKLCSKEQSAVSMTAARGTMGYIAPEVVSRTFGRVSYKSDVYSFGMLLLEMVGGRKNMDHSATTSQVYFPQWIYNRLIRGEDMPEHMEVEGDECKIARQLTVVGLWCIQWCPADRPSMKTVVQMLEGDGGCLAVPPSPFPATSAPNSLVRTHGRHHHTDLDIIPEV
ncbi:putative receptor-like protein kinase [Dorcoceras hygrometricum]|uniref:Putative receptor-like protein kinase n=1 Tax=Dorcoceras hygrometricum TaxID=472368 RepID=A0A2Z7A6J4_9LAMI|nr:putative receptor-like protein kinase [Dorcoceras hygrometricum]